MKIVILTGPDAGREIDNPPGRVLVGLGVAGIKWETLWPREIDYTADQVTGDILGRIFGALLHGRRVRIMGRVFEPVSSQAELLATGEALAQAMEEAGKYHRPLVDDGEGDLVIAATDGRHLH